MGILTTISRLRRVSYLKPNNAAHSIIVFSLPLYLKMWVVRLFLACTTPFAHRQFPGEYPPLLSIRSKLEPIGTSPISKRNDPKELVHRLQTLIPLPPYAFQSGEFGFWHRFFIRAHVAYVLVLECPCVVAFLELINALRQPQLLLSPLSKCPLYGSVLFPQSHKQTQDVRPCFVGDPYLTAKTTRLPNLLPTMLLPLLLITAGCTVAIPNVKVCAVSGVLAAGMDCAYTLDDKTEEMNLDQSVAFLEPQIEPPRGAAMCMSSEDFSKLKSALEQACKKLGTSCTKEAKANIAQVSDRVDGLQARVREKRKNKHNEKAAK